MFLDVLESTATKRDAKSYLSRFGNKPGSKSRKGPSQENSLGVNLGGLYKPFGYVQSPFYNKGSSTEDEAREAVTIHLAIVKIRATYLISDEVISGIGSTLSRLAKLGMLSVILVGQEDEHRTESPTTARFLNDFSSRIVEAIQTSGENRAQVIDQIINASKMESNTSPTATVHYNLEIENQEWLHANLMRGIIPVVPCVGVVARYGHRNVEVEANNAVLAMARELTGTQAHQGPDSSCGQALSNRNILKDHISLDRIIVLDPLGGIPSADRDQRSHIYINMEQEYQRIKAELKDLSAKSDADTNIKIHMQNLDLVKNVLSLLPPSSSGFITTPQQVAKSENRPPDHSTGPRVRTRRQRNPLIHNLLTDKPAISSSLPYARSSLLAPGCLTSTFVKRGMPVTIIPGLCERSWTRPSTASLSLLDPRIDLTRLIHLIEASFKRKLNVNHYLERLQNRTAGLVVVGEYDGCALFTWETPPESRDLMIPYLDKFAVLPQWQGTGVGVADILFKTMVKDCFPHGVCWRSRADNTVNKWYFERAKGTWKVSGTRWTSFWTTEDASEEDLKAYEGVCRAVEPSWVS